MRQIAGGLIKNMSIRKKIIVVSMLLLVLAATSGAVIQAYQIHRQTRALISERLQNNANMAIGIFGTVRIYTEWMLDAIATMAYVRRALLFNAYEFNLYLEENLKGFFNSMNYEEDGVYAYANMFVFDADFQLVALANPEGDAVDLSLAAFSENIRMTHYGLPFVSPVVENPQSGLLQFLFTQPVMIDDTFLGMVAILSNTEVLEFFLREPTHDYDSFINIADSAGTLFFSNRPAYIGRHLDDLGVYEAFGYIPFNTMFNHNSAITGIDKIAYITIEPLLGWTVVSFFDAHAVENIAWAIFLALLPTVSSLILAAVLMMIIVRRSLTPLNDLAATAKNVAHGNLDVKFDISRNDEISQVSQSFFEIVTALNILQDNFRKAENAMKSSDADYVLEDSRLGGVYDEMLARTNNVIKHMQRSKMEAESASKAKSDFLSKMSHEIRTPMNAILGMAELILRENISDAAREQAVTIKQSGDHLLSIINDILDISKVESGKLEIINTEYYFHSIVQDVINIIRIRMTNPKLHFAVYMQHDIPNELFGNEVRIRQILLNLLTNALKYTPKGFFSLDITSQRTSDATIMLTIKVKDTGIGIKPENMGELFGEFNQFDIEKNHSVEGTGLGLAITQKLITLMGGRIEVSSKYGEGTEFIIHLPQEIPEKESPQVSNDSPPRFEDKNVLLYGRTPIYTEYAARVLKDLRVNYHIIQDDKDLQNRLLEGIWDYVIAEDDLASTAMHIIYACELDTKIVLMTDTYVAKGGQDFYIITMPVYFLSIVNVLSGGDMTLSAASQQMEYFTAPDVNIIIVDDIETNLKVAEGLLKPYDMGVTLCLEGREAIEAVKSMDYDLVLMDHMMPGMDGIEATRIIRGLAAEMGEKYAKLPIIALTANAIVGVKEMFLQNGFNDFLSKPIEIAKLNSILANWIPKEKQKQLTAAIDDTDENGESISRNIEIEDVDVARGIILSGGNADNYLNTLKVFHRDGTKKVEELANCLKDNNLSLYTIHVHALKSACGNIGAKKLSGEAKDLEIAGISKDMDFISNYNGNFVENMKKLLADISDVISAITEKSGGKTFNRDTLNSHLAGLKTALENFDLETIDKTSGALRDFAQMPGAEDALNDILQNTFIGKYKLAVSQIEEFLSK